MSLCASRLFPAVLVMMMVAESSFGGYEDALEFYLKGDHARAAESFDTFVRESPSDPRVGQAVYYAAVGFLRSNHPEEAAIRLRPLLARPLSDISTSSIRLALGLAHRQMGDETTAMRLFESAWLSADNPYDRAAAREQIRGSVRATPAAVLKPAGPQSPPGESDPPPRSSAGQWAVQVVSTPDRSQADSIFADLERAGWPVYRESATLSGAAYIRVRVGPYASESDAARAKSAIRAKYGIEGWLTRR